LGAWLQDGYLFGTGRVDRLLALEAGLAWHVKERPMQRVSARYFLRVLYY
jgi:hypothetical protein